ncbi:tRNA-2-methylthio-N(6)-dimethylallyladenosine synthase [subsurface metagenome]
MKYHIITFGCQMNEADSERIRADLERKKYTKALKMDEADLIVVNMCSVRQSAVDRVYGLIPKFKRLKAKTILTGCILKEDKRKLKNHFNEIKEMQQHNCCSTLIPISKGCNNFCSYCVVPFTRGRLICHDHQAILKEVKRAVKGGVKEIWLLGQNVNDYHSPADKSVNFAKLLKQVNDIEGNFSIRFISPHPKNFTDALIATMAKSKKVAKYLNLPVQSGDNQILKRMKRPYTIKQYKDLVKKIRKEIPEINLSTDVIVGFPGETKKHFANTVNLFKEIKFDMAYISKYSKRPGTTAFQMKDNIPLKEKKRREKILRELI